jgi:opacity protein-like surface antigen
MRAIVITALGLLAASPALANPLGIGYVGLRGSYVQADDQSTASVSLDDSRTFRDGWGVTGFMGFVIDDALRGEIEAGYRINELETVSVIRNDLFPASEGSSFPVDGQVDMGLAMANLYYDFHFKGLPVLPWVGIGVGGAYVNYSYAYTYDPSDPPGVAIAKDSDWQFAYQLMAGVTVPVAERASMTLGYRYFATEEMVFVDAFASEFQTDLTNHSIDLGIQFHL